MSITRGEFLRSLGKSLPGMVTSSGVAAAAGAIIRRVAQAGTEDAAKPVPVNETVPFFESGSPESGVIALTFDDGPVPGVTETILDTLRGQGIQATFFLIGEKVAAAPELARRIVAEGHEIGHHTYTHRKPTLLPDSELIEELDRTTALFEKELDHRAAWFRPPFGALRQDQARRVRERGMSVALWSLDSEDWRGGSGGEMIERVLTYAQPGSTILLHEIAETAASLDALISRLREKSDVNFATISDLANR